MKAFITKYLEETLIGIALFLSVVIIGYFVWGIMDLSMQINQVVGEDKSVMAPPPSFDLSGAAQLDLKGQLEQ